MTTIAYNHEDKQVAVDSRSTAGGIVISDVSDKAYVNKFGTWVLCGAICDIPDFITLSKYKEFNKDLELEVDGLRITDNVIYRVFMHEGVFCEEVVTCNVAFGSGSKFALAAMDHGKSAEDAVKYAMTRDIYSGGKVNVFDV